MADEKAIIAQGRRAFMMGSGLVQTDRGFAVSPAINPFKDELSAKLWEVGHKQAQEKWYESNRRKDYGKANNTRNVR